MPGRRRSDWAPLVAVPQSCILHAIRHPEYRGADRAGAGPDGVFHMMGDDGYALCHVRGLSEQLTDPQHALSVPAAQRCKRRFAWPGTGGVGRPIEPLPPRWPDDWPAAWYVWWTLFDEQRGMCAMCPNPPHVIDHDHATDLIRGGSSARAGARPLGGPALKLMPSDMRQFRTNAPARSISRVIRS